MITYLPTSEDTGKPIREIEIQPLEEPVPSRLPAEEPAEAPVKQPEKVPA